MDIPSFPKICTVGHRIVREIFEDEVEITEKLDGSQFAFGIIDGELAYRSKGRMIPVGSLDSSDMFYPICRKIEELADRGKIYEGYVFYGEYLREPRHNTLQYERIPTNMLAIFGMWSKETDVFCRYHTICSYADSMEFEAVPLIGVFKSSPEEIIELTKTVQSKLGGPKLEGVVIKNYEKDSLVGRAVFPIMTAKFVTDSFKEVNKTWKANHTNKGQWESFKDQFATEARWLKAVQSMRDRGILLGEPKDIGQIMNFVMKDISEECQDEIKEWLWKYYGKELLRDASKGVPNWYKEQLALGTIDNLLGHDTLVTADNSPDAHEMQDEVAS